jgi:hypothetical protein
VTPSQLIDACRFIATRLGRRPSFVGRARDTEALEFWFPDGGRIRIDWAALDSVLADRASLIDLVAKHIDTLYPPKGAA